MSLRDQVILDVAAISAGEFSTQITLTATSGETATVNALDNNIGRKVNNDTGMIVNTKNASVVVSEVNILAANPLYPVRGADNEVRMLGHTVAYLDAASGITWNYIVKENPPDGTVGLITLLLGDLDAE